MISPSAWRRLGPADLTAHQHDPDLAGDECAEQR
jgi:hypothetical protein